MASFILCHFVNGVVDSIEIELLSAAGNAHLVFVGTGFSRHTLFEVGLGVPNAVAEKFGKLGSVFSFFPSIALESLSDFGIAFAIGLTSHSEIHTHFATLAVEVSSEVFDHLFISAFGNTDFMFGNKLQFSAFVEFFELAFGSVTDGALFGSFITFVNIATNGADKFL